MTAAPDTLSAAQRAVYDQIVGGPRGSSSAFPIVDETGELHGPFGLMVRFPEIGAPLQALGAAIRYQTSLTARAREIAILTVASETESEFEAYAHRLVALSSSMTAAEVTSLLEGRFTPADAYEHEVLKLSRSLLSQNCGPEPQHVAPSALDARAAAEVTALVGYYRLLAQLMRRFSVSVPRTNPRVLPVKAPDGMGRELALDLYEAANPDAPVLLYLHGGGWVAGSRTDYSDRFTALVERGVTVASLDYRLATEAPYPSQRDDIAAAILALDLGERTLLLAGASAGATLAALAAVDGEIAVDGFVGFFGRYDLTEEGDSLVPPPHLSLPQEIAEALGDGGAPSGSAIDRLAMLAGVPVEALDDTVLKPLSPVCCIDASAPPMLLVHGTGDAMVDHRHSVRLAERAHRLGVACELILVPAANHEGVEFAAATVMDAVAQFAHDLPKRTQKEG